MNYVELHIGDYEKATAHLTACEDGIYGRLLRRYYDTEAPLPLEIKAVQRLVRARTREEREAVETILDEFFYQAEDGWRHKRCDEEIARFAEKRAKAQRSARARWNASASASERNANASTLAMRTHSEGNAHQTPDTRHQTPDTRNPPDTPLGTETTLGLDTHRASARVLAPDPASAGEACRAMRDAGLATASPSHPELLALIAAGATPAQFAHAAGIAVSKGKGFGYALGVLRGQMADAAAPIKPGKGDPESIHHRNRAVAVASEWLAEQAAGENP